MDGGSAGPPLKKLRQTTLTFKQKSTAGELLYHDRPIGIGQSMKKL